MFNMGGGTNIIAYSLDRDKYTCVCQIVADEFIIQVE